MKAACLHELGKEEGKRARDGAGKDGVDDGETKNQGWRGTFVFGGVQPFDSKTTRRSLPLLEKPP